MNLATARSAKRAREVGMRKVFGAGRSQLMRQFLGESFLTSLLAVALSWPLVVWSLPVLNTFLDKSIELNLFGNRVLLWSLIGTIGLTGLVAGLYPAFVLSGFRPYQALKGAITRGGFDRKVVLRKALVITQFAISIVLIIGTLVAWQQLHYLRQANLGYDKEQVIMVNIFRSNLTSRYDEFKNRLLENSHVLRVTTSEDVLGSKCQTNPFKPEGTTEFQQFQRLMVGHDFVETFKLELLAGRSFSKSYPTDDSLAVLVNETMLRQLGWGTPQEGLGKGLAGRRRTQVVVGVLKDFHFTSLHTPIEPFVLDIADTEAQHNFFDRYLAVRIAPDHYPETITFLEKTWSAFMPDRPFEYFFMDDELEKLYLAEDKLGRVAGTFSAFALFVACLGLLGIASFMAETRTSEIGIRKVLGATTSGIVGLLSKEFLALVGIAIVIAAPLAYYLMNRWLQDFAYRTDIDWWVFAVAGAVALVVAFLTVSYQSVKAALANPVKSLRSE